MSKDCDFFLRKIIEQKLRNFLSVFQKQIPGQNDVILLCIIALSAVSLIPGHDGINVCPFPCKNVIYVTCGRAGAAVQIQQNRIADVLPVNVDPLFCAVDINIHRFVDAAFGSPAVNAPADFPDHKEQN